jgi:alpha-L-fucosidase
VRTIDNLVGLYFTSVGRNSKLLLNVPPTRDGWLHHTDVERLAGMRQRLQAIFANDLTRGKQRTWKRTGARSATTEIDLGREASVGVVDLGEEIAKGQLVARYVMEGSVGGEWKVLSRGTTIGYRKLDRFAPVTVQRVRFTIEDALDAPRPVRIALHAGS